MTAPILLAVDNLWSQAYIQQLILLLAIGLIGNWLTNTNLQPRRLARMVMRIFGWGYQKPPDPAELELDTQSKEVVRTRAEQLKKMGAATDQSRTSPLQQPSDAQA
ncbi:hypothetical protein CALVIDRAFT_327747 [Calocera viscosa TUFC12733]|uniref:Uncharacterized protein n=1 Tax=Calocera viscosa (strain TUFC12733) TaxID=1330018 RepID=A0A167QW62_CALVF|nr:hypothetical protein CALVIDRAFT_327747 [Calocera viscosa TUFC12733]